MAFSFSLQFWLTAVLPMDARQRWGRHDQDSGVAPGSAMAQA
jgi:hypothetical protein